MDAGNSTNAAKLVEQIQELSDDIEKVVIPPYPYVAEPGAEPVEASLVIHLVSGQQKIIPSQQDAEAILP